MSTTILTPLSNATYTKGKGVAYFYPTADENDPFSFTDGYRLGDMDSLALSIDITDSGRDSNEYATKTRTITFVDEVAATVSMKLAQMSDTAIAASLMGKREIFSQPAQPGLTMTIPSGSVRWLGGYDIALTSVTVEGDLEAVAGVDYLFDAPSGQIEAKVNIVVAYDIPAISGGFVSGIASGRGLRGMLLFRSVNAQGRKSVLRLHSVDLKPGSGGREYISDDIMVADIAGTAYPVAGQPDGFSIGFERLIA